MLEQTKRIEALDVAKGIGIILVMIGHMTSSYLYNWIYSFHIPLFFILSGICFKNTKYTSFLAFARQRIKTLAIPTLTLYLIILSIEKIIGLKGYDLLQQLKGVHPDYLWFLITLFFSEFSIIHLQSFPFYNVLLFYLFLPSLEYSLQETT